MKPLFFYAIHFLFISCSSSISFTENINNDYYFYKNSVQIQGESEIPDVKSNEGQFLSITERRNICIENAMLISHSKWLALTVRDREDPAVWLDRLKLGAVGPWDGCLKNARILNIFYDDIRSCRIAMLYRCHPAGY